MRENQFSMVKSILSELEKDFMKLKDWELKDGEVKTKREVKELLFKPIVVSIDDMDKFDEKGTKKIRLIKNTLYDWLINYILESIRKSVGGFKDI